MSRRTLPQRRECDTLIIAHGGQKHYCSWSRHSEGHLAEIFIAAGKTGSAYEAIARDLAVAASLALQHGCPEATLRHALTRLADGLAAGPLGVLLDRLELETEAGHAETAAP